MDETIERPDGRDLFAGRYRLGRMLKRGNGVDTLVAEDVRTGEEVVLKSIDAQVVHAAARLRFEHETRVLRELSGSGLAELHDSGEADNRLYLVQPRVHGQTLESMLRSGRLSVSAVLRIGIDIARALSIAHDAGILHRDVKPANVIVDGSAPLRHADPHRLRASRRSPPGSTGHPRAAGRHRALPVAGAAGLSRPGRQPAPTCTRWGSSCSSACPARPPFQGDSVGEVLRQHLTVPARRAAGPAASRAARAGRGRPAPAAQGPARPLPVGRGRGAHDLGRDRGGACGAASRTRRSSSGCTTSGRR